MHPRVHGMVAGKSDFVHELGSFIENGELNLQTGLQAILLVTRSPGGAAIDWVSKRFKDQAGLRAEYEKSMALRFYGKSLNQPA